MSKKSTSKPAKSKPQAKTPSEATTDKVTSGQYVVKEPVQSGAAVTGVRRFTLASFRSRRKRRKAERRESRTRVEHSFRIFNRSVGMLRRHWEVFGGLTLIYLLLNLLLVGGNILANDQLQLVKDEATGIFGTDSLGSYAGTGVTLYGSLVQTGVNLATGAASAYQTILLVVFSLVYVWALRQLYAGNNIRVRDALYNASYPLVQVLLVLGMVLVHLIPAVFGTFLFGSLVVSGVVIEPVLQVGVTLASFLFIVWSAYLLSASLFALYIATLPDMSPLAALRTAKKLVKFRRGMVVRKLLYLPLVLLPLTALIVIPLALVLTPVATFAFFAIGTLCVPFVHSYMYALYRELIQ